MILRASRDADKITGYMLALENERMPAKVEKHPQIERPSAREVAQQALAEVKRAL